MTQRKSAAIMAGADYRTKFPRRQCVIAEFAPAHDDAMDDLGRAFQNALAEYGTTGIADRFGLHANTVVRWMEKGVPASYRGDFLRLAGAGDDGVGDCKTKDQYYTKPHIAAQCYQRFGEVAKKLRVDLSRYHFIEPSAGCGWFYDLLPAERRIGIDLDPKATDGIGAKLITHDYLTWSPKDAGRYVVIGNPPFGLRGHLALQFINHSYSFADMVAFILPPLFNSDGKGVPAKRVRGYQLAHTENLPTDAFQYPDGRLVAVSSIFQVWTKINTERIKITKPKTCKQYIKVYSLSDGGTPASTRNKKMLYACDVYLPSTCFKDMRVYNEFEQLPHRRGYGVKILKQKRAIKKLFNECRLEKVAFRSTNGALNLRTSLIESIVIKGGFYDQ